MIVLIYQLATIYYCFALSLVCYRRGVYYNHFDDGDGLSLGFVLFNSFQLHGA